MSLEENVRTPHMWIQEWLTAELLNSEVEEKTSASRFSSTRAKRTSEGHQSAMASFGAIKIMVWCSIKLLAK